MKIKAKIQKLPPFYKGHDIMFLKGGKEFAKNAVGNGELQAFYNYQAICDVKVSVALYKYQNEQCFIVSFNDNIANCVLI